MGKNKGAYYFTRMWFDYAYENQLTVTTNHTALFCWLVELNNRLAWIPNFQITSTECMMACGFKTYKPYKNTFDDLVEWGFVDLIRKSINQYQPNVIGLSKITKATNKAIDKARQMQPPDQSSKQPRKQVRSNRESNAHIHSNSETRNNETFKQENLIFPFESEKFKQIWETLRASKKWHKKSFAALQASLKKLSKFPETTACEMMENAIAGEWQGLFEISTPKTQQNDQRSGKSSRRNDLINLKDAASELLANTGS